MGEITFIRHKRNPNEYLFESDAQNQWKYQTEDGEELDYVPSDTQYHGQSKGTDQFGNIYNVKFVPGFKWFNDEYRNYYNIYESDEDGYYYKDNDDKVNGNIQLAKWSDLYDPNSTVLNEVVVYPKTADLILKTYDYLDPNYLISHSAMSLEPLYPGGPHGRISKGMDAKDYNLFNNNCADGTCSVAEIATGKKAKRRLITTPSWIKKFIKENGGVQHKDGTVHLKLDEETAIAVAKAMKNLNKKWGYYKNE